MISFSKYTRLYLALFHLVLGVLLVSGAITKYYSLLIVLVGVISIYKSENKRNEAIFWSAYLVGGEVLFRMAGGMVFHELPKYSVLAFLFLGLFIESKKHHISVSYLIYILLLLIGIAFIDIPFNESIRTAIAFNLSGPVLLGVASIYFYKRKITLSTILEVLFIAGLPIISMLSFLYFKTPNFEEITFGGAANTKASGGFGPNQVATLLGFGVFIFAVFLFFRKRVFFLLFVDVFIFMYLVFRGLITFSRGGMLTAFIAITIFVFYYIAASKDKLKNTVKYGVIIVLSGVALWIYTSNLTSGMLENRYTNKNAAGITKDDITTGRIDLFKSELSNFYEHPFFGIGVGGSKYERMEEEGIVAASHNEMSRLLSEHGMIGLFILILLLVKPLQHILRQPLIFRAFLSAFLVFWFLTINHSAMRVAFPAFIYGLSLVTITKDEENTIHRK